MTVRRVLEDFFQKREEIIAQAGDSYLMELFALSNWLVVQFKALSAPEDEITVELRWFAEEPPHLVNAREHHANLWIDAAQLHPSLQYLESLCTLLEREGEAINYEGIVDILYDLKDARAIPSLIKAINYHLESDPTKELQIKILETLERIHTPEALDIVREYLKSPNIRFREMAELLLKEES